MSIIVIKDNLVVADSSNIVYLPGTTLFEQEDKIVVSPCNRYIIAMVGSIITEPNLTDLNKEISDFLYNHYKVGDDISLVSKDLLAYLSGLKITTTIYIITTDVIYSLPHVGCFYTAINSHPTGYTITEGSGRLLASAAGVLGLDASAMVEMVMEVDPYVYGEIKILNRCDLTPIEFKEL